MKALSLPLSLSIDRYMLCIYICICLQKVVKIDGVQSSSYTREIILVCFRQEERGLREQRCSQVSSLRHALFHSVQSQSCNSLIFVDAKNLEVLKQQWQNRDMEVCQSEAVATDSAWEKPKPTDTQQYKSLDQHCYGLAPSEARCPPGCLLCWHRYTSVVVSCRIKDN